MIKNQSDKKAVLPFLLIISILLVACSLNEPQIRVTVELEDVAETEYKQTIAYYVPPQDALKKLIIEVNMVNSPNIKNRQIEIPRIYIDDPNGIDAIVEYQGYIKNNQNEIIAEAYQKITFDARGLTFDDIYRVLDDQMIVITWDAESEKQERTFSIGKHLVSKE